MKKTNSTKINVQIINRSPVSCTEVKIRAEQPANCIKTVKATIAVKQNNSKKLPNNETPAPDLARKIFTI
uniref:Uncharacterized protein n=1 Tax=Romanomermis culicivorax TaxID=13658 RepID=A0A915KSM5_ROMCU